MNVPLCMRRRPGRGWAGLVVGLAVLLAGCGDADDGGDDGDGDQVDAADAADADGDGAEAADADGGDGQETPPEVLTAADGWNGPPEAEGPDEPGVAVLRIEGQEIELELECDGGLLEDHGYLLFEFSAIGQGETDDGRAVTANAGRDILDPEEAAKSTYEYGGQESGSFQVTVEAEEGWHTSIVVTPADDDPAGEHLPVVHVAEDGTFSAVHDLEALAAMHDTAPEGPAELAGRCQEGWDDP